MSLSDAAAERIREIMEDSDEPDIGVRVGVKNAGCAGMAYTLNYLKEPGPGDDHVAHYYPWTAFNDHPFNSVGMGLIEALLTRLKTVAPQAEVVLNLGCRIGKATLVQVLRSYGYRTEELASRIVRQHAGTDISFFAALENAMRGTGYEHDVRCEFYADPGGRTRLSARQAKSLLDAGAISAGEFEQLKARALAT